MNALISFWVIGMPRKHLPVMDLPLGCRATWYLFR